MEIRYKISTAHAPTLPLLHGDHYSAITPQRIYGDALIRES